MKKLFAAKPQPPSLEKFFRVPDEKGIFYCSKYMPKQTTVKLEKEMKDTKKTPAEEKKKIPKDWDSPCKQKNHNFYKRLDMAKAPPMLPEQVHEALLRENFEYHEKIIAIKDEYIKTTIFDNFFEAASSGYWNVRFLPIVYPDVVTKENRAILHKQGFFCLAMFHADFLKLALEQMLMDEMFQHPKVLSKLEEAYAIHNRIRCMISMSMHYMGLKTDIFNYRRGIRQFLYREIASPAIANLRTLITLRSCYLFSVFVWRVLYIYRFDAK